MYGVVLVLVIIEYTAVHEHNLQIIILTSTLTNQKPILVLVFWNYHYKMFAFVFVTIIITSLYHRYISSLHYIAKIYINICAGLIPETIQICRKLDSVSIAIVKSVVLESAGTETRPCDVVFPIQFFLSTNVLCSLFVVTHMREPFY